MNCLTLNLAGETLLADAARALVWPERRALLIADLHLGKAQVFRQAGLALPDGSDARDLRRLADVVARHAIEQLYLLGDIVHGATASDASWRGVWQRFAADHRQLDIIAIVGNHDRHDRHALVDSATVATHCNLGRLGLRHHPVDPHRSDGPIEPDFVVAGHLHPLTVLVDGGRHFRLPCFWLQATQVILPAFGSTTRGQPIQALPRDRIIAVTPAGLIEVPNNTANARLKPRGR